MPMKKYLFLSILLLAAFFHVNAQSKPESDVAAAVENFRKGIESSDRKLLESVTSDDVVYGHSSGKVQNKAEFVEEIVSLKPIDYLTVELTDQTIKVSGDVAVVRHVFSSKMMLNGTAGNLKIGNMLVWKKEGGSWKLIARQAYKM
jgi:ketosteroid isomerase-like protein